jgi:hypothetical protein
MKQQKATRDSSVLMGDCLPCFCCFCHDLSAQSLEFFSTELPGMPLLSILGRLMGTPDRPSAAPASYSFAAGKVRLPSGLSLAAMKHFN